MLLFWFFFSESSCIIPRCFLGGIWEIKVSCGFYRFCVWLVMALIKKDESGMCGGWGLGSQTEYPASAYYTCTYTVISRKYSFYIPFHWDMLVVW